MKEWKKSCQAASALLTNQLHAFPLLATCASTFRASSPFAFTIMASDKPNKLAFLSMPAPASYVAGLGRGASGFTTRSDIGPAREGPSEEAIAEARAKRGEDTEVDPEQFQDPDNEVGLFAGTVYEQDDEEADRIYETVDENMDARRRARREAREAAENARFRAENPKLQQQFADLKRGLAHVSDAEWEGIPEVGNLTRRKRRREERSYVVPDSVLVGDRASTQYENSLDPMQQDVSLLYPRALMHSLLAFRQEV
jgi:pre-mRNA-processing factor 6